MSAASEWISLGSITELVKDMEQTGFLKEITLLEKRILLSYHDGQFGALDARCNHMGGPLVQGRMKDGCVECPWHYWEYDHRTGESKNKSYEPLASCGGSVASYPLKTENGELFIDMPNVKERVKPTFNPMLHVAREPQRAPGKMRVLAISTTAMDKNHPRYSTSEDLLKSALKKIHETLDLETQFIALSDLKFRNCEGFYSKSEKACTWPCSITKMDPSDEMVKIYEALVHWADVVLIGTPIRWGSASSLYYKMVERLNSVQNQITVRDRVLIKDKVAAFVITGGQDNIQSVAGQMLTFFGELGFISPAFPFVAHSLGWSAEDMAHNVDYVQKSESLHEQTFELAKRAIDLAKRINSL